MLFRSNERAVPPPRAAAGGNGVSRADTLCLDVPPGEFERELAFWAALTGQQARPAAAAAARQRGPR